MNREDVLDSVLLGIYLFVAIVGLGVTTLLFVETIESLRTTMTRPFSLSFTGGMLSYYLAHPFKLYPPANPVPRPTIYPPLLFVLSSLVPVEPAIIAGRIVSWLAIAASSLMLSYHGYRLSGRYTVAILVGGLFFLTPSVSGASVVLRVDHLALAFALAAITAYTRGWPLWTVVGLSVAAGFSKQPYAVLAIGSVGMAYLVDGQYRDAARYVGLSAAVGLTLLGGLVLATDGRAWAHLVTYNHVIPWYMDVFLSQTYSFLVKHGLTLAIAIGAMSAFEREDWADPIPWLFIIGLGVAFVTLGREGSWIGYFYPVIAAGTVLISDVLTRVKIQTSMPVKRQITVIIVLFVVVLQMGAFANIDRGLQKPLDAQKGVNEYLQGTEGLVLSEDPSLVPGQGRQEAVSVFVVMGLVESGAIQGDPLADAIRCGRYDYVVTWIHVNPFRHETRRWTEKQLQTIDTHFQKVYRHSSYTVYEYNGTGTC